MSPMSSHNVCFYVDIRKLCRYALLSGAMFISVQWFNFLGPVVQSVNELIKGHFVNCFCGFSAQYSDIFC